MRLFLLALIARRPSHGYELIRAIEDISGGRYVPSPGVIYPNLSALEEGGFVSASEVGGRKSLAITSRGQALLEANHTAVAAILSRDWGQEARGADPIRAGMHAIKSALTETLARDDPDQSRISAIGDLLQQTARAIRCEARNGLSQPLQPHPELDSLRPRGSTARRRP